MSMSKTSTIQSVISLLDITLDKEMPPKQADKIVSTCISLLRDEYNSLIGE